jgi:hypothetical protein
MGTRPYVIRQGDYLTALAFRFGFDAQEVWGSADNEGLRARRPNPELLAPGDVLRIPDAPREGARVRIGTTNRYRARVPGVPIVLRLEDRGQPLADEPYRVEGLGAPREGRSGADGVVRFEVPATVREVRVVLPRRQAVVPVRVGHLDPIEERSGVRQRLEHLGYYFDMAGEPTRETDAVALRRFQRDRGLAATGELDDETRRALAEAHGS